MPEKPSISDEQLKQELIAEFEKGNSVKTELLGVFRSKYKIGSDRFSKIFDPTKVFWSEAKEKATLDQLTANTANALKSSLKTKLERMNQLEKRKDNINKILDSGKITETIIPKFGDACDMERSLTPIEIAKLTEASKSIDAELSKMHGDYAPTKISETDPSGNDKESILVSMMKKGIPLKLNNEK